MNLFKWFLNKIAYPADGSKHQINLIRESPELQKALNNCMDRLHKSAPALLDEYYGSVVKDYENRH